MKTCIYTLLYIDGEERLNRNIKFVNYYRNLKEELGFTHFYFCDNASPLEWTDKFIEATDPHKHKDIISFRYNQHLERKGVFDYPYCWRGLHTMRVLIDSGFEKILCIDSDMYVLTKELAAYIKNCNSGWEAFWCNKYSFPEAALHILNKDKFDFFMGYTSIPWERMNGLVMEKVLPFSKVNQDFLIDRYGEERKEQKPYMHAYGQCPSYIELKFNMKEEVI